MSFIKKQLIISAIAFIISFIYYIYVRLPKNRLKQYHTNFQKFSTSNHTKSEEYDYIIIGGGTSGCVLANRLSENGQFKVLLLEAGPTDDNLNSFIPVYFSKLIGTEYDWGFASNDNSKVYISSGKVLGGSSVLGNSLYMRGSDSEYKQWEWPIEEIYKNFNKSVGFINGNIKQADKPHDYLGSNGEFKISDIADPHYLSRKIVREFKDHLKIPFIQNFIDNKNTAEGIGYPYSGVIYGEKLNMAGNFLSARIMKRENLYIRTSTQVKKILIENGRAIGVELLDKQSTKIYCKKEVILSAGTINSPHLLMMSGIGDREILEKNKIEVVYENSEVGRNLYDQPTINIYKSLKRDVSLDSLNDFPNSVINLVKWILFRTSDLAINPAQVVGFIQSDFSKSLNETEPDLMITFYPYFYGFDKVSKDKSGYTISISLLKSKSRGKVELKNINQRGNSEITLNHFNNTEDLVRLSEGVKKVEDAIKTSTLKEMTLNSIFPNKNIDTDEKLLDSIKQRTISNSNLASTCSMGKVVDKDLKVKGIKDLRVIDSSVIPTTISGDILATTVMIAEKGSKLILNS